MVCLSPEDESISADEAESLVTWLHGTLGNRVTKAKVGFHPQKRASFLTSDPISV